MPGKDSLSIEPLNSLLSENVQKTKKDSLSHWYPEAKEVFFPPRKMLHK